MSDKFQDLEKPDEGQDDFDADLPPLIPMEESDVSQSNPGNLLPEGSTQEQDGRSRPSRQLRNRSVARSISKHRKVEFQEVICCVEQDQNYQENIKFEKEGTLFPPLEHRDDLNYLSREKWELLHDPTPSKALKRTRQQASVVAQHMLARPLVSTVCLMGQKAETSGYTVLSDVITKKMDREERKYQKAMMICVQGIGASLNESAEALDVVDGLGQSHHDSLRNAKWETWSRDSFMNSVPNVQPWASVIQQTLSHQNVPEYFQKDDAMKHSIEILEEEVVQTTACTPKNIHIYIYRYSRMDNSI